MGEKVTAAIILLILAALVVVCMWQEAKCHFQLQLMNREKNKPNNRDGR